VKRVTDRRKRKTFQPPDTEERGFQRLGEGTGLTGEGAHDGGIANLDGRRGISRKASEVAWKKGWKGKREKGGVKTAKIRTFGRAYPQETNWDLGARKYGHRVANLDRAGMTTANFGERLCARNCRSLPSGLGERGDDGLVGEP